MLTSAARGSGFRQPGGAALVGETPPPPAVLRDGPRSGGPVEVGRVAERRMGPAHGGISPDRLARESAGMLAVRDTAAARLSSGQSESGRLPPVLIQGETGVGKGLSRGVSTARGRAPPDRSSTSTAPRFPRPCWRPSSSATSAARSPTRAMREAGSVPDRQPRDDLSWTRSASCPELAGEAPEGARGPGRPPARQHSARADRRLDRHGEQRGPDRGCARAAVPRGPVSPPRRWSC